jgi:hypothetical protein
MIPFKLETRGLKMCVDEVTGSICQALAAGGGGGGGAHRPAHLAALIHLARHAPLAAVLQAGAYTRPLFSST